MSRTVLVSHDSPVLRHASTRVLNRYPNGAQLVVTDAPLPEAGVSGEMQIPSGLKLNAATEVVEKARQQFQAREQLAAETEGAISAYVEFIGPTDNRWLDQRDAILTHLRTAPGVEILGRAGNDVLDANRFRIRARVRGEAQANLLELPRVLSVEAYRAPIAEDEVAGLILAGLYDSAQQPSGSYLRWLQDHGIDGRGVTVGIVDGGVDISHPAFSGRARDLTGGQKDWHATMVAGHAAGNYLTERDANQFIYGLGTAPAAEVLSQDKMQATTDVCRQTVTEAGPGGAPGLIQNNSWGKGTHSPMDYGSDEAIYDALVRNADPNGPRPSLLTICFSSGNSGSLGLTRPKAAKNLIVTGNSESFRPHVGYDGSDNISEVYSGAHGSSYGNCGDRRIRPHVVAPGEWTASANFDCHAGEDEFISPMLTWGGGSSGASPKTAGVCALLTQWWRRNNNDQTPSPAMLRALIVNGAEPILTGGTIPNNRQGWGRLNIQNILDPSISRILVDQTTFLSHPTETREWHIRTVDPTRPVKITLTWTDPPGAIGSGGNLDTSPVVNKLALRAEIGPHVFRGVHDRFRDGFSASDDAIGTEAALAEGSDNLQNIFLAPLSVTGAILVSITTLNVTTNCMNGMFDTPQQDFALVITNGQIDAGASPANIVVAVDRNANGSTLPSGSNGHWTDATGNDDSHLITGSPATSVPSTPPSNGTSSPPSSGLSNPPVSSQADDAWWADDDLLVSTPETGRQSSSPPPTNDTEFVLKLDAGFNLLDATGHRAGIVNVLQAGESPSKQSVADLGDAIARLKGSLDHGAADPAALPFCAVLVVGAGTRVTIANVLGLRALGFMGRLFLVSDNPEVIAFLAQRIGKHAGIRYRLAKEPS